MQVFPRSEFFGYAYLTFPLWNDRAIAESVEGIVKDIAKRLRVAFSIPHTKGLEAISKAGKFSSYFELRDHLKKPFAETRGVVIDWRNRLEAFTVFFFSIDSDAAYPPELLDRLESMARVLETNVGIPAEAILDSIFAPMLMGESWLSICIRDSLSAKEPLYRFKPNDEVFDDNDGRFVASAACEQLSANLYSYWEAIERGNVELLPELRVWLVKALEAQPEFLEGGYMLAHIAEQEEGSGGIVAAQYLEKAETLIPSAYRGKISWGYQSNRFFLQLLHLYARHQHRELNYKKSVATLRKLVRLNPTDNQGARLEIPLVLLADGQYDAALTACKRFGEAGYRYTPALTLAFVAFAQRDTAKFRAYFYSALISLPWLRLFLENGAYELPAGDDGIRGVQPDLDAFCFFAWNAYCEIPGLRQACLRLLKVPEYLQAENELRTYWLGFWQIHFRRPGAVPTGDIDGYDKLEQEWLWRLLPPGFDHLIVR